MPAIASLVAIACVSAIGATNAAAGMDSVGILVGHKP